MLRRYRREYRHEEARDQLGQEGGIISNAGRVWHQFTVDFEISRCSANFLHQGSNRVRDVIFSKDFQQLHCNCLCHRTAAVHRVCQRIFTNQPSDEGKVAILIHKDSESCGEGYRWGRNGEDGAAKRHAVSAHCLCESAVVCCCTLLPLQGEKLEVLRDRQRPLDQNSARRSCERHVGKNAKNRFSLFPLPGRRTRNAPYLLHRPKYKRLAVPDTRRWQHEEKPLVRGRGVRCHICRNGSPQTAPQLLQPVLSDRKEVRQAHSRPTNKPSPIPCWPLLPPSIRGIVWTCSLTKLGDALARAR
mmetsp:Transcript_71315/g.148871  ORF Transcript_71315/g.148871 Transcript_71315/m.148871 type:complete len:302 (+) Transcript_71315:276-1181(+)